MVTVKSLGFWLACAVLAIATPSVSRPSAATGKISGVVVDGVTRKPLADATVKLVLYQDRMCEPCVEMANPPPNVLTASDGKFEFDGVPAGAFQVKASKSTYGVGGFGVAAPTGDPARLDLAERSEVSDLTIALYRRAVVKGTVTDEQGKPVERQVVSFMTRLTGSQTLDHVDTEMVADRVWLPNSTPYTDDRGNYVAELPAGEYLALVNFIDDVSPRIASIGGVTVRNSGFVSLFFPGARSIAAASPIRLKPGEIREHVNFRLKTAPIVTVAGRVEAPAGVSPTDALDVKLLNRGFPGAYDAAVRPDRSFAFPGVPSGNYTLSVVFREEREVIVIPGRSGRPDVTAEWKVPLSVPAADVTNLLVRAQSTASLGVARDPRRAAADSALSAGGTSRLRVAVVDDQEKPVSDVRVDLSPRMFASAVVTGRTDKQGIIEFSGLRAGSFAVVAEKPGYRWAVYGWRVRSTEAVPVALSDGESRTIRFAIERAAVIAGTIRDARGKPVSEAVVTARRWTAKAGQRVLEDAKGVLSDPDGHFRLNGLTEGTYVVTARVASLWSDEGVRRLEEAGDTLARVDQFASLPRVVTPGSIGGVSVKSGQQRDGIDMVVELRVRRMATVEGTLVLPLTGPFTQPPRIVQFDDPFKIIEVDSGHRGAAMDETGRFVFTNVQPGKHRVYAHDGMRWAIADIETSGEKVGNLVLTPQAGSRVTGRLVLDSNAPPRDVSTFAVHLWAQANLNFLAFEPFPFSIDINGHFVFQGIPPGPSALDYFKDSSADLWRMESAVVGGVDALDFPFKVTTGEDVLDLVATLTDKRTRLTGVVLAEDGQPSAGPVVVAFPPDSRYWVPDARRVRLAQSDSKGRFAFPDLPAGDYLIAAIPNSSRDADWDPSLLARLRPAGIAVHLATGDSKFVEVQVR